MANRMILNETSYFGAGSISEIVTEAKKRAFKKALVVTDPDLIKFNVAKNVTDLLEEAGLAYDIFSQVKANPTVKVVKAGIEAFKAAGADYLIAIGGGSSMDTAKAIGIIINNPEYADVTSLEGAIGCICSACKANRLSSSMSTPNSTAIWSINAPVPPAQFPFMRRSIWFP